MTAEPVTLSGGWAGFHALVGSDAVADNATTDLIRILDTVEVPIVVVRRDFVIAGFNNAAAEVLGFSAVDVGRASSDVPTLAGMTRLEQECAKVLASGVESQVDVRYDEKWFVVRISPNRRDDGQIAGLVLSFTNVTAFRASLDLAVYERESTKAIINTVADPLVVLSSDLRIQSANRAFFALFEVSRDETQGLPLADFGDGAFALVSLHKRLSEMLEGSEVFQSLEVHQVVTAKGRRTLLLDARPLSFAGHVERRALVTFQDITSRKLAEAAKDLRSKEELRRSEAFLAEGQRLSQTGTFSWRADSDQITWSEQLYRIYEFEIGVPVTLELMRSRVHPEDVSLLEKVQMMDQAHSGLDRFEWQYRLLMPDQSVKYLHAVAHAVTDHDDQLEYIAAVQDVTARRLSEEALAEARSELVKVARAASLGVLTASIAHEVNQPLSGIITNASTCLRMLDAEAPNVEGARETARRTLRDGNRVSDMITRLRALFSNDDLVFEVLDLNEITREVLALMLTDLQRYDIDLQCEFAEDLSTVTGDRIQLQQVISNLIRNASDAMEDVHDRSRQLLIRTSHDTGDRVRVSVADSGVGLEPESTNKMLDAFYTTKPDGMGLGLSISRSIIERHQGKLWAEPNNGPGATFSFSIPNDLEIAADARPRRGSHDG